MFSINLSPNQRGKIFISKKMHKSLQKWIYFCILVLETTVRHKSVILSPYGLGLTTAQVRYGQILTRATRLNHFRVSTIDHNFKSSLVRLSFYQLLHLFTTFKDRFYRLVWSPSFKSRGKKISRLKRGWVWFDSEFEKEVWEWLAKWWWAAARQRCQPRWINDIFRWTESSQFLVILKHAFKPPRASIKDKNTSHNWLIGHLFTNQLVYLYPHKFPPCSLFVKCTKIETVNSHFCRFSIYFSSHQLRCFQNQK